MNTFQSKKKPNTKTHNIIEPDLPVIDVAVEDEEKNKLSLINPVKISKWIPYAGLIFTNVARESSMNAFDYLDIFVKDFIT